MSMRIWGGGGCLKLCYHGYEAFVWAYHESDEKNVMRRRTVVQMIAREI